jgi:hypothetical protein
MPLDESLKNRVLDILESDQESLDGSLENQSDVQAPETVTRTSITQNSEGRWERVDTEEESGFMDGGADQASRSQIKQEAETLQEFCRQVDNHILSLNDDIDSLKSQIVTLSTEAIGRNCNPGIAHSTAGQRGDVGYTTSISTEIDLNREIENIKIYSKMAGPDKDYNAVNVFDPDTIQQVNSSYSGFGYRNLRDPIYYKNNDGTVPGSSLTADGSGANLGIGRFDITTPASTHAPGLVVNLPGYSYDGAGVAPDATDTSLTGSAAQNRCVEIKNEIDDLYDQILTKRRERDSLRGDLNTIKETKKEKELASWGLFRIEQQVDNRRTTRSSAIDAVRAFDTSGTINLSEVVYHIDAGDTGSFNPSGVTTSWTDISSNGWNTTLFPTNSPAEYEYSDGGFITFNGSDEYADSVTKSSDTILGQDDFTIEVWFRVNGAPSNTDYSNVIIDTNASSATAQMLNVTFGKGGAFSPVGVTTNRLTLSSRPTTGDSYTHLVGPVINNGYWYHGVVVRNGTENTKLYTNGQVSNIYTGDFPVTDAEKIRLGRWTDGTSYANISIAKVKIYERSFTDREIQSKYDGSKDRFGLVGVVT